MNKEILIENSRLKLIELEKGLIVKDRLVLPPSIYNKLSSKALLVVIDGSDGRIETKILTLTSYYTVDLSELQTPYENGKHFWVLMKSDTIIRTPQSYTNDEIRIILYFLNYMWSNSSVRKSEKFIRALGIDELTETFYRLNGNNTVSNKICFLISKLATNKEDLVIERNKNFKTKEIYSGHSYSVYHLLKDLVEDKASILIDPGITSSYKRISLSKESKPTNLKETDKWMKVLDIVGNKNRANLSLKCLERISLHIPEDKNVGVEEKDVSLLKPTCFNIIRDGLVNIDIIGIRGSKNLIRKLRRSTKCFNLLYSDEVLVDLSKMKLINRSEIKKLDRNVLSYLVLDLILSKIAITYYKTKRSMYPTIDKRSDEEKYLNNLGIFGNYYFSQSEKKSIGKTYTALSLEYGTNHTLRTINEFHLG